MKIERNKYSIHESGLLVWPFCLFLLDCCKIQKSCRNHEEIKLLKTIQHFNRNEERNWVMDVGITTHVTKITGDFGASDSRTATHCQVLVKEGSRIKQPTRLSWYMYIANCFQFNEVTRYYLGAVVGEEEIGKVLRVPATRTLSLPPRRKRPIFFWINRVIKSY